MRGRKGAQPAQLKASSFCSAPSALAAKAPKSKAAISMDLSSITDNDGSALDLVKGFAFFGATFVPSFFLAGYFLGGYYPLMAVGAPQVPRQPTLSFQSQPRISSEDH
eukprot:2661895-Rhodomonas_salina.2